MLTPDSDLPTQYLVQGNIILLFNKDYHIRQDALAALMYLLLDQDDAELYLPNIQNITDVIPSNICLVDSLISPKQKCVTGIHEVMTEFIGRKLVMKIFCSDLFSATFNGLFNGGVTNIEYGTE